MPKGWAIWRALEDYMRRRLDRAGYQEVRTPQLVDRKLWEASGHWEKFRENMFLAEVEEEDGAGQAGRGAEADELPLPRADLQPGHQVLPRPAAAAWRSSAPATATSRHGALHGIMRVRGFTQDDAHIFCREDQITPRRVEFCALLASVYRDLGFDKFRIKFSDRPEKRAGSDEVWDQAESGAAGGDARGRLRRRSSIRARAPSTARSSNSC